MTEVLIDHSAQAVPVHAVTAEGLAAFVEAAPAGLSEIVSHAQFKARPGQVLNVPPVGGLARAVLFGVGEAEGWAAFRALPSKLAPGDYRIVDAPFGVEPARIALAWALGSYRFDRYKKADPEPRPRLVVEGAAEVLAVSHACALARDMVNTPANDLGPLQIETIAREIARQHDATIKVTTGAQLLEDGYPAIHAVGRAAVEERAPRIIEISWGEAGAPLVAVIGKGVVFDTGGLDIKPSAGMRLMKKDMGGAAHALALARMVMAAGLAVRLVVLIPVVENAISGDAMRPGDILSSRAGLTIEVGNTDAEGRLILADALTRAGELEPELTIDLATLTGAARVALGPQVVPFFTADDALASDLSAASLSEADPLWRLPLWAGYEDALDSEIADIANDPAAWALAGSVTAALFLKRFAPKTGSWLHLDIFAWNNKARPGYPSGGEAQAIRALLRVLKDRYG